MLTPKMRWQLEFDKPDLVSRSIDEANDVSHALEKIFVYPHEGVVINWGKIRIPIPYCYGVSDTLEDILDMLDVLMAEKTGEYLMAFSTNEILDADWLLSWSGDDLRIHPEWRKAPIDIDTLNRDCQSILVSKKLFCRSWADVFQFLIGSVSGVRLQHNDELIRISKTLEKI